MAHNNSNLKKYLPFGDLTGKENYAVTLHTNPEQVTLCGTGETPIGVLRSLETIDSTTYAIIRLWSKNGTIWVVQGESIAPGAFVKSGAGGKVYATTGSDPALGKKLSATSGAAGDVIEVLDYFQTTFTPPGNMGGSTAYADGAAGLVPKPLAGQQNYVLTGGGLLRPIGDIIGNASISEYTVGATYSPTDLAVYENALYRCTVGHIAGSTLDDSKWVMLGGMVAIDTDQVLANISGLSQAPVAVPLMIFRNALDKARIDIASASTTNIGAVASPYVRITGTTTITAFDSVAEGIERKVLFAASLTLTHNATSLILVGGSNIVTEAGDTAVFVSEGGGNWRCSSYNRASGSPLIVASTTALGGVKVDGSSITISGGVISASGGFKNMVVLASGSSWQLPAGKTCFRMRMVGGGASGGGGGSGYGGAGGGAGAYLEHYFSNQTPLTTYGYGIGSGGAAVSGGFSGNSGGATTFTADGITYTANGGVGGNYGASGQAALGGQGGSASNGSLCCGGEDGENGMNNVTRGGRGGASHFGGGGRGGVYTSSNSPGGAGHGYGAGGGGGSGNGGGGAGTQGCIVIEY